MKRLASFVSIVAALIGAPSAYAAGDHESHQSTKTAAETALTDGLVKKVDKSAGKVTIAHEPLINLGMPKMTMVFRVKDPGWLDQLKEGDKIRFLAEKVDGAYTVVRYEPAQ